MFFGIISAQAVNLKEWLLRFSIIVNFHVFKMVYHEKDLSTE